MTDNLALQYSWSGQKNTIRFKDLLISKLILSKLYKNNNIFIQFKYDYMYTNVYIYVHFIWSIFYVRTQHIFQN